MPEGAGLLLVEPPRWDRACRTSLQGSEIEPRQPDGLGNAEWSDRPRATLFWRV